MSDDCNGSDAQRRRHEVIIAAAVAAVLGDRTVLRSIQEVRKPGSRGWARQGRAAIQGSHQFPAPLIRVAPDWGLRPK